MLIGIDIGGTKIAVQTATVNGELLTQMRQRTDLKRLVPCIKQAISQAADGKPITAIGLGIPGMVDPAAGVVTLATNLNIVEPLDLVGALSAEFPCPINIENDVRLAALGVQRAYPCNSLAYLSIGTGVSAGLILNGKLWRGANGMAGEIGHVAFEADGTILEQRIAGPAIVRQARQRDLRVRHASDVYQLADDGDPMAGELIDEISDQIARAVQWLVLGYDVERVVIGGGVAQVGDIFESPLYAAIGRLRQQSKLNQAMLPDSKITVLPNAFNAGLHGGIALAMQGSNAHG